MAIKRDVTLTVRVSAEDIAHGRKLDCWACPIARATSRAAGQSVHVYYGNVSDGGGMWDRRLPREAAKFQHRFDRDEAVEPFAFEVSLPRWYVRTRNGTT